MVTSHITNPVVLAIVNNQSPQSEISNSIYFIELSDPLNVKKLKPKSKMPAKILVLERDKKRHFSFVLPSTFKKNSFYPKISLCLLL